jgi:hypothetical protein
MIDEGILQQIADPLLSGRYNLLLGSGISLGSTNYAGELLPTTGALRLELCDVLSINPNSTLERVYGLLTDEQKTKLIYDRFRGCAPALQILPLRNFVWKNVFTFNVDDVVEAVYEQPGLRQQYLALKNFDDPCDLNERRDTLPIIHLHGSVRKYASGFVFSYSEYVRIIAGLNPWMHILSEVLATEPFIISGTSLSEVDLEYYLSHRTPNTPRRGRGPSLLVEPYPDAGTEADCRR